MVEISRQPDNTSWSRLASVGPYTAGLVKLYYDKICNNIWPSRFIRVLAPFFPIVSGGLNYTLLRCWRGRLDQSGIKLNHKSGLIPVPGNSRGEK